MKNFLDDFMLDSDLAELLYKNYASELPIIDYHCHISPKDIAEDKVYENITQLWLSGDHYKWRAMRSCGISERLITGDADDYEKFEAFCSAMPSIIGNPVYVWSHLELKRYFGYEGVLSPDTCREVWEMTKAKLADMSVRKLIAMSNVKLICTTDDPCDSLEYHVKIREDRNIDVRVLPAFRPDKSLNVENKGYAEYINRLSDISGAKIDSFAALCDVLDKRMEYFDVLGCRTSDHSLEKYPVFDASISDGQAKSVAEVVYRRAMKGDDIDDEMARMYKTALMRFLADEYAKRGWVMQLHVGAMRNNNSVMFGKLGPDTGYDTIRAGSYIESLSAMLNAFNSAGSLPKTIIYSLNPADNEPLAALCGCFQYTGEDSEGLVCMPRVEQGSAWWFNDNEAGMTAQLNAFARQSALGKFVGMTTDSRSFTSYTRHEYFRRVLCNVIAGKVEAGLYPLDIESLAQTVCDICYNNAKDFFGFKII